MHSFISVIGPTLVALCFSFLVGLATGFSWLSGLNAMFVTALLAILEVSLSFDNALMNATVLREMSLAWRRRFLTWGMLSAVLGMRTLFPLLVVCFAGSLAPWRALKMAISDPAAYAGVLALAHVPLAGFGGGFLTMAVLDFFFNPEKESHWFQRLERVMSYFGRIPGFKMVMALEIIGAISTLPATLGDQSLLLGSGLLGILAHLVVHRLGPSPPAISENAAPTEGSGLRRFLYLELLDASLSFDGVIGAFSLTDNLLLIMSGLGVGALAVRTLTLKLVNAQSFTHLRYLEHGTFYAIGALAGCLLLGTSFAIPGFITGGAGAALIGASLVHSVLHRRVGAVGWAQAKLKSFRGRGLRLATLVLTPAIATFSLAWSRVSARVPSLQTNASHAETKHDPRPVDSAPRARQHFPLKKTQPADPTSYREKNFDSDSETKTFENPAGVDSRRATFREHQAEEALAALEWATAAFADSGSEIMRDARALLSGLRARRSPADVLRAVSGQAHAHGESVQILNRLAEARTSTVGDAAEVTDFEAVANVNVLRVINSFPWGDILADGVRSKCADHL